MSRHFLKPDFHEARRFLNALQPSGSFTFQTFPDLKGKPAYNLTKIIHGELNSRTRLLHELNQSGAGIFVTVSKTDLMGRKIENITGTRAVFVDLDGAPLTPVLNCHLEPHIIVETSPNRWHAYWLYNLRLADFILLHKAIIKEFDSDPAAKDLSRVMRLPGFYHQKNSSTEPFMTRMENLLEGQHLEPDTRDEVLADFPTFTPEISPL